MRFVSMLAALLMIAFGAYAIWDLKVDDSITPPVPRDEHAKPDPAIAAIMAEHANAMQRQMSSTVIPRIDQSIGTIGAEYGTQSPQMIQALSEAAIMLADQGRSDTALPYMQKAAEAARATYGPRHRETALILHDLANLKIQNSRTNTDPEAITLLEETLTIRRRILGNDHPETRGAKLSLADALFSQWLAEEERDPGDAVLAEAAELVETPFSDPADTEQPGPNAVLQARAARLLYGRISFARQDYEAALAAFNETLTSPEETEDPTVYIVLARAYNDQIGTLRALGRDEEADALRDAINAQLQAAAEPAAPEPAEEATE